MVIAEHKTAILTGATGFLGSHILRNLLKNGFNVVVLKRSTSDVGRISDVLSQVMCFDLDKSNVKQISGQCPFDLVIHAATNYGRHGESIVDVVHSNVLMPLEILEATQGTFINFGTILDSGLSPYTTSKSHFMDWLRFCSKKVRIINIAIEHMYGPGDDGKKFVSWFMEQVVQNEAEIRLTSGEQYRDFVYIDDIISAFSLILKQHKELPEFSSFDVGSGAPIQVRTFVAAVFDTMKSKYGIRSDSRLLFGAVPYRIGEAMRVEANIKPLLEMGWRPQWSMRDGVEVTVKQFLEDLHR